MSDSGQLLDDRLACPDCRRVYAPGGVINCVEHFPVVALVPISQLPPEPQREPEPEHAPRARTTDPPTSHAAAASVAPGLRENQKALLECLRLYGPCTDEELAEFYDTHRAQRGWPQQSLSGLRTRRSELADMTVPLAEDTGQKRRLKSGRLAIVWRGKVW